METPTPQARADAATPEGKTYAARPRSVWGRAAAWAGEHLRRLWRGLAGNRSVRSALFAFTISRTIVLTILIVGGQVNLTTTGGGGGATRDVHLSLRKIPLTQVLRNVVGTADVTWYTGIATEGYEKIPFKTDKQYKWAFFPLFPMLWRCASILTGEVLLTGMLLSHLFFLLALFFVHRAALAFGYEARVADRALFYLAIFPTAYFYSLPMTESLFLLLTAGSLYSARRGHWFVAGVCGALASATRTTGVLLLPALAVLYWQTYGRGWRRKEILSLCLVPAGLLCYMAYLHAITGNAFAFKDVLVTWGRGTGFFLVPLLDYLRDPLLIATRWDFRVVNFTAAVLALACGAALLRKRQWALGVYTLV